MAMEEKIEAMKKAAHITTLVGIKSQIIQNSRLVHIENAGDPD